MTAQRCGERGQKRQRGGFTESGCPWVEHGALSDCLDTLEGLGDLVCAPVRGEDGGQQPQGAKEFKAAIKGGQEQDPAQLRLNTFSCDRGEQSLRRLRKRGD